MRLYVPAIPAGNPANKNSLMKDELAMVMESLKINLQQLSYLIGGRWNGAWEWVDGLDASNMDSLLCDTNGPFNNNILVLRKDGVANKCLFRHDNDVGRRSICVTKWQP